MPRVTALLNSPAVASVAALAIVLVVLWRRRRARREQQVLRETGYRLIHELKAYSAWIDMLHGEPSTTSEPEQLTAAQALRQARAITQSSFPELSQPMLRLLRADSRLMRYLWEQKLLRLAEPGTWVPHERDRSYWHLRNEQEDLIDELIARCRVLMHEHGRPWRATDMNSEFFGTRGIFTRRG